MKITYSFFTLNVALLVLISSFSQQVTADQLYKWVDKKGNVTYQSSPPPDGAVEVEESEIRENIDAEQVDTEVVFETDPIKFYTKPECPTCDQARTYFEEMEIPFEEVDISEDTAAAAKMERNFGHNNVPTMKVGNKSVTGYEKGTMGKILKGAGYNIQLEDSESPAEVVEVPAEERN
jgi:glutaredoxin